MDANRKRELLEDLVFALLEEREQQTEERLDVSVPSSTAGLWQLFRALVNTRPPWPAAPELLSAQDELLQGLIEEAGVSTLADARISTVDPRLRLWRGDITTLAVDAIVNAANSQMLGCWQPNHLCIDNAIHTYAGVQLRIECAELMRRQGHLEPTGSAKITAAWNLPSKHVIHTVGPICPGEPGERECSELASCYRSCLDMAATHKLGSIAFCGISTGVFGFPAPRASRIAVATVREWLDAHPEHPIDVVFNVFSERDEALYEELLF